MACIVIIPLDQDTNMVEVEVLPDLKSILGEIEPKVLSNLGASLYARQMAIHLNVSRTDLIPSYILNMNQYPYLVTLQLTLFSYNLYKHIYTARFQDIRTSPL